MELVTTYKQSLASAKKFQNVGKARDSIAFNNLGKYFHWHYFEELHSFAPSKFIGYKGTTVSSYASQGTGTETVRALGKIFNKVVRPSQQFDVLAEHLSEWLESFGKTLSQKTLDGTGGIYIRKGTILSEEPIKNTKSKTEYFEGDPVEVRQTRYERDPKAREDCLKYFGYACQACKLNFEHRYGEIGREFIHVHHIEPLSIIGRKRKIEPTKDLIPLCPNCHAMIHKLPPPQTLDILRGILR